MATSQFNISAVSPLIVYDPQQDAQGANSDWVSDPGEMVNNNANSNPGPRRVLHGTGTATIAGFGSGLSFAGSLQGVYCSYNATLRAGKGNNQDPSTFPARQTGPPATGMLASFTGLEIDNWELQIEGNCGSGSFVIISQAIVDGWVGVQATNQTLGNTSPQLMYSGVDWSEDSDLTAPFYNDTQHYTNVYDATMNITFSGSAIVLYSSVDAQHGPYSVEIHRKSSSYNIQNAVQLDGSNLFLAVPVPFFCITGLDPTQQYTLVLKDESVLGGYVDVDYVVIWTSNGGPPPNGGTSALGPGPSPEGPQGSNKNTIIIAASVGGGVALILLVLLFLWRRRKTKVQRRVRPTIDNKTSSIGHSPIPLRNPPNQYSAEQQGLLYPAGPGSPSFPPLAAPGSITSSGGYDPYAPYGGYSTPPGSAYTGLASPNPDHVQIRRLGKAAEAEAARERERMRVTNAGSIASPTTPHPDSTVSQSQSWDTSSKTAASSVPHNTKTPEEPPPKYEQP